MKKIMSLVMAIVVLTGTLWFSTGSVAADGTITYVGARFVWGKGVVFVFEASGFRNRDIKDASLSIGSNTFGLHCHVNKKAGKIVCVAGSGLTQYAGQIGLLSLAGHAFYVKIPDRPPLPPGAWNETLSCPEGLSPGADVTFGLAGGGTDTTFVPGATLSEVRDRADNWLGGMYVSVEAIGGLHCAVAPN